MSFSYLTGVQGSPGRYVYEQHSQKGKKNIIKACVVILLALAIGFAGARTFKMLSPKAPESNHPSFLSAQTVSAAPAEEPTAKESLSAALETWAGNQKGEWGVYVDQLDGDQAVTANWRAHTRYELASIYKLFLMKPLSQKIPAGQWDATKINERTYGECVDAMLALSDNGCATAIADRLGWRTVHYSNHKLGYKDTIFNKEPLVGTAADTGLLLERLYSGDAYDQQTREKVLAAMKKPKKEEAIRRNCDDCTVYNKTGDFNGLRHDAAIVEKNGKAYSVVIFSKDGSWKQLRDVAALISEHL